MEFRLNRDNFTMLKETKWLWSKIQGELIVMKNLKYILAALIIGLAIMSQASGERSEKKAKVDRISLEEAKHDPQLLKAMTTIYDLEYLAKQNRVYINKNHDETRVFQVIADWDEWKEFLETRNKDNGLRNISGVSAIIF